MKTIEVEIYWSDLSEDKQNELLLAGFENENITNDTFPVTTLYFEVTDDVYNGRTLFDEDDL